MSEFCEIKEYIPPVPTGMDQLSFAHIALIEQFYVDQDVIKAVASLPVEYMSQCDTIEHVLDPLSRNEMKALLERVAAGQGTKVMSELNKQSRCSGDDTCRQRMTCADFAGRVLEVRYARVKQEADARARKKPESNGGTETAFEISNTMR